MEKHKTKRKELNSTLLTTKTLLDKISSLTLKMSFLQYVGDYFFFSSFSFSPTSTLD